MKSKVFIKFLMSYGIVLVIPTTLLSFFIYVRFTNTLKEEVMSSTTDMLYQVRDVMDGHINNLNNISAQINDNKRIRTLLYDKDLADVDLFPKVQEAMEELKNYKVTNNIIYNCMLYFRNNQILINDSSKYDADSYFSRYFVWKDTELEALYKRLNSVTGPVITKSQPVITDYIENNVITYMRPMPINVNTPSATLIISINSLEIDQMVTRVLGNYTGTFYMLDRQGNVITSTTLGNEPIDLEKAQNIISSIENQNITEYSANDGDLIISFSKSRATGWRYVAIINSKPILRKVEYVKSTTVKIIFISLLIGMFLAYFFSKENYGKVKKIIELITGHSSEIASTYKNEWEYIDGAIISYVKENNALQCRLDDQMPVMKNNFFTRLIKGRFSDLGQIRSMMLFLNINLENGPYSIVLLNLDTDKDSKPELTQGVLRVTISNASERFCQETGTGYSVELDLDRIALLVSMEKVSSANYEECLKKIGDQIRSFVKNNFGITVTVGVSCLCTELININKAYEEALTALDYQMIKGKDTVICFNEINNRIHNENYYSFNQEKQILSYLKIGEYEAIKEILDGVIDAIKHEPISLEMVKCIYFEIVNTAIRALHELGIGFAEIKSKIPSLVNTNTIDAVCNEVCLFYKEVCQKVNSTKYSKSVELVDNIINYLDLNYNNNMMSVDLISDEFAVSSSYLSHIFKERSGQSFTDYLHSLRLRKAKELLIETDGNIADIADKIGYNSPHNFIRVFKRYEGITPTEFRFAEKTIVKNKIL